jgi:DNA-binding SARP family transcriptional activator
MIKPRFGNRSSLSIQLLGRPRISSSEGPVYEFRSRKSWALLAYLILNDRAPTRSQLASLLYGDADDPGRALRWNLTELRHALGERGSVDGDPVDLQLSDQVIVDADVVIRGSWMDAVRLPGLGAALLEGFSIRGAAAFDTWLLSQQRHLAAAAEAILHEAALGSMSRSDLDAAIDYAARAVAMSPLDENHQALLIRLYRLAGDDAAAQRQFDLTTEAFQQELGVAPGPDLEMALRQQALVQNEVDTETIEAIMEAGSAAVGAGAFDAGIRSFGTAAGLADGAGLAPLRISARVSLAEVLIHSLRGFDEEGLARLYEADEIAQEHHLGDAMAQTRAELGYVDFLRARYDRAERWLREALRYGAGSLSVKAKATTYLGSVESDRANYAQAAGLLRAAVELAQAASEPRRQAYALAMLGRIDLLRGELIAAASDLEASIKLAEHDHWLAFLPWPQALLGETWLTGGDRSGAARLLRQAFARACQLKDPCWEGISARALALVADAQGATDEAFQQAEDARVRSNRLPDPYVWLDGYILDALCELGRRHGHPETGSWVETLRNLASRTGMRELTVRSMLHGAALGNQSDAAAARLAAADIDNPRLAALVAASDAFVAD